MNQEPKHEKQSCPYSDTYRIYNQALKALVAIVCFGCTTVAAIRFGDPRILWFYLLALFCAI